MIPMPVDSMLVRSFEERDREACRKLLGALPDWFGVEASNRSYIEVLGRFPTAVAVADDHIVGFAALEQHSSDSIELYVIAVDGTRHRAGIGSKLVAWSEQWCREHSAAWFHVKTRGPATPDPGYERTRQFYLAQGFTPLFESLTLWGPEDAALVMVKHLV